MEAERVVVELIAKIEGFDIKVAQSAATFETGMKRIEAAAGKAEQAFTGSTKRMSTAALQASTSMYRGYDDVGRLLVSDRSPFVVPVKNAPAVVNALKYVQAGAAALGGVLGGVAATGAMALAQALVELIFKNRDTAKEVAALVEKMREQATQAGLNEQANAIWERSLDGLIAKTRKLRDEQERQLQTDRQRIQGDVGERKDDLDTSRNLRNQAARDLDSARRELSAAQEGFAKAAQRPGRAGESQQAQAAARLAAARAEVARLTSELQRATVQAGDAGEALRNAETILARMNAANLADPIKAIGDHFGELKRQAEASIKDVDALTKRLAELNKQEQAAKDKLREPAKLDRQVGGSLTSEEAKALVNAQFGAGAVTSGRRSAEHNKNVGGVPGSFHVSGQAIDVAKVAGVSVNKLKSLISAQGVIIEEAIDEGDHFHIAWRSARTQAERLAAEQKRLADAEANRAQAYDNERAGLEDSVLDARQTLLTSAEEISLIELAAIDLARAKYADQVAHNLDIGKLHQNEANELLKLNEERAALRREAVQRRDDERKFRLKEAAIRRQEDVHSGSISVEEELLQSRSQLATTATQRKDLEARLIDLQFAEERMLLQGQIERAARLRAEAERTKSAQILAEAEQAEADAAIARQRLATLPERLGNAHTANIESNAPPLQQFFSNIPDTATEINTALESIAAGGLATFTDALTDAIVNWEGFGNVALQTLRSVAAGLIRLGIQQLLLQTIGKSLGSAATAATTAQATAAATSWAPAAAMASLATLGANAGPAAAALAATNALAMGLAATSSFTGAAGRAGGGRIHGPGGPTSDSVPIWASNGEYMIRARAARQIGYDNLEAMNNSGMVPPTPIADTLRPIRPTNAAAVAPRSMAGVELSPAAIAQLGALLRESNAAMPPINLFPTHDPVAGLRAALNTREGRQVMLEFGSENRGALGGVLGG